MKKLCLACLAAFAVGGAAAQNLKPGLWEVTHKMGSTNPQTDQAMAQMHKQMANMPPEQRKMMEEMLAKQGVQMGAGGGAGGMSLRVCLTREMVERNELPTQQGDCKTTSQQRSGNTLKLAFSCANPPSSGEGQFTFTSPESYAMKMSVNTTVRGKAENMTMDGSGKWLGADCGSVKPLGAAAAKK